jgi:hypothetical protein
VNDQPASLDLLLGNALAGQNSFSALRLSGRKAEPEGFDGPPGQPAVAQIGARLRAPFAVCS